MEKTDYWYFDKPARKTGIDDDEMAPIDVTNNEGADETAKAEKKKVVAKPKEVVEFEKKKPGKKKIRVRDGSTGY